MGSAVRIGLEATHGTVATTFKGVPCAFTGKLRQTNRIPAEGRMGQDVHFSATLGLQSEDWAIAESPVYHDTFGIFLAMVLGAPTKVVVDTIFDNTFKFADDPKSASVEWDQPHRSTQPFRVLYAVVDEMTIAFDVNGDLTFAASGCAMPEGTTSAPAYAFSTVRQFAGWAATVTKGGSAFAKLLKGDIKIKRNRKPWFAYGGAAQSRTPSKMTIGDRTVDASLICDFADLVEYNDWKAATTASYEIKFEDSETTIGTVSKPALTLRMGKFAPEEDEIDPDSDLPTIKVAGKALYYATDASSLVAILRSTQDYTLL